jgi:hypothetical protein
VDTGLFGLEESTIGKTRAAYPPEFRRQMVDLVRAGRSPEELAREFEPRAQSIRNWLAQSDELHPGKTRIVYCKVINRTEDHPEIQFTFLGYTFRPRKSLDKYGRVYANSERNAGRGDGGLTADSEGSRPRIRDDVAQHSDLISLGVPR